MFYSINYSTKFRTNFSCFLTLRVNNAIGRRHENSLLNVKHGLAIQLQQQKTQKEERSQREREKEAKIANKKGNGDKSFKILISKAASHTHLHTTVGL